YSPTGDNHYTFAGYARDGATCLYQGISDLAFGTYVRDTLALQGSGRVDGHYRDGEIAAAYRPDKKRLYVTGRGATRLAEGPTREQRQHALRARVRPGPRRRQAPPAVRPHERRGARAPRTRRRDVLGARVRERHVVRRVDPGHMPRARGKQRARGCRRGRRSD